MAIIQTLTGIYADNGLSKYFGSAQAAYYANRYRLWLFLQPCLMFFAIAIALAIKYAS